MKHRLPQLPFRHPGAGRVHATVDNAAAYSNYRSLIAHLLKTRPLFFWGGVWTSIFLVSLVAVGCLLSPSASSNRTISAIAADAQPVVEPELPPHRQGQVPIWIFGAIVLTCTTGSILITHYLKLSSATSGGKRASRTLKPALKPVPVAQSGYPEPSRQLQPFSPTAPLPFPVLPTFVQSPPKPAAVASAAQKATQKPNQQPMQQRIMLEETVRSNLIAWLIGDLEHPPYSLGNPLDPFTASEHAVNQPMVTVVPADESHPLDWADRRAVNTANMHRLRALQAWLAES